MSVPRVVVFDVGGVLIDFDDRRPCRGLFDGDAELDFFLDEVIGEAYHLERDRGVPMAETTTAWCHRHPDYASRIRAFAERLPEMWIGPTAGSRGILAELKARGTPVYGLSNWGHETWPLACEQFPFLSELDGVLISAEIGVIKPDRAIYEAFCARFGVDATEAVFIDDATANVEAAQLVGFRGIRFVDAPALEARLRALDLL